MKKLPKWLRIAIIAIAALVALACIISALTPGDDTPSTPSTESTPAATIPPTDTPIPTSTPIPTDTPRPTNTPPPTATPSPEETALSIASETAPAGHEATSVSITDGSFTLSYFAESIWSAESALRLSSLAFLQTAPDLLNAFDDIDTLTISYETIFVDTYGNENQAPYLVFSLDRDTANKIKWDTMLRCNLPNVVAEWYLPNQEWITAWEDGCQ